MNELSVRSCLAYGWSTFKARPGILIGASLAILAASLLIQGAQTGVETLGSLVFGRESGLTAIVAILAALAATAASFLVNMGKTAFYLQAHDRIEDASLETLWHPQRFWYFVGASILVGISVLVGLVLLIVPGIIVGIMLGFTLYRVIDRGEAPMDAMRSSAQLTRGNRWKLFLLGLALVGINVLGLLALVVGLLVSLPVSTLAVVHAYRTLSAGAAFAPPAPGAAVA